MAPLETSGRGGFGLPPIRSVALAEARGAVNRLLNGVLWACSALVALVFVTSLFGPYGVGSLSRSSVDTTILTMGQVNQRVELYVRRKGLPTAEEGLQAVYGGMDVPRDSWGNEFLYVVPSPNGLPYDIVSYGADGRPGGTGSDADLRWSEVK